jgi:hypothetical protein
MAFIAALVRIRISPLDPPKHVNRAIAGWARLQVMGTAWRQCFFGGGRVFQVKSGRHERKIAANDTHPRKLEWFEPNGRCLCFAQ